MSRLRLNEIVAPTSPPSSGKVEIFVDSADEKVKVLDDQGFLSILTPDGMRDENILINGDFSYAQRQVPTTLTSSAALAGGRQYAFDRWFQSNLGTTALVQTQQVSNAGGAELGLSADSYAKYKVITTASKLVLGQVIENGNTNHLNGMKVRFSCKMRYTIAASMSVRLGLAYMTGSGTADTISQAASGFISAFGATGVDPTLTAAANLAYITPLTTESTGTINGSGVDINLTNSWVRYSATFLVPASARNLIPMVWSNATLAANDELNISECGFYAGEEIRDWFSMLQENIIDECQRYYFKTFSLLIAPAYSVLPGTVRWSAGVAGASAGTWGEVKYPVRMRTAAGTVAFYSPVTAASAQAYQFSATAGVCTSTTVANQHDGGFSITTTPAATAVIGSNLGVQVTVDNEI